jgi:hypothetical protein
METALGILLSFAVILLRHRTGPRSRETRAVLTSGLRAFFYSAVYFALAMQLATIYGLGTADFGALETQIAQAMAVVSLLPLLYPAALLESADGGWRQNERLLLLSMTVALSFYPFLSRCLRAFGGTMIGDGEEAVVDAGRWTEVERMCFADGLDGLRGNGIFDALPWLQLFASLGTYLFTFWLLEALLERPGESGAAAVEGYDVVKGRRRRVLGGARMRLNVWFGGNAFAAAAPLVIILGLTAPMLWVIFHLRELQEELAERARLSYGGNEWGFGQVVSIVLFVPVGVEMLYRWRFGAAFDGLVLKD